MKKLALFLSCLLLSHHTRTQYIQRADFDILEFKQAAVQAYNSSESFTQNFYELLGLICPESVYCQNNGIFDTEGEFRDLETEEAVGAEDFLQNYDQAAISEARTFLQMNANNLEGCCEPCSCEDDCRERQNCCPSMDPRNDNTNGSGSSKLAIQKCVYASNSALYSFSETIGRSFYIVKECGSSDIKEDMGSTNLSADAASKNLGVDTVTAHVNDYSAMKCTHPDPLQPDEILPVYSIDVKKIYRNIFCARCYNVSPVIAMSSLVTINHEISFSENLLRLPSSPYELFKLAVSSPRFFSVSYIFPSRSLNFKDFGCTHKPPSPHTDSGSCDANPYLDNNQRYVFKRLCEMEQYLYSTRRSVHKNVFCYLCDQRNTYTSSELTCGELEIPVRNTKDSYSVLLTGSLPGSTIDLPEVNNPPEMTSQDNARCSCAQIFYTSNQSCREILCPPGEIRNVCDCVPFITNVTGLRLKIHLELRPKLPDNVAKHRFGGQLQGDTSATITKAARKLVASKFGPLSSEGQFLFSQNAAPGKSIWTFHYCEILTLKSLSDNRQEIVNMFTILHAGLTRKIVGEQMTISLGRIFNITSNDSFPLTNPVDNNSIVLERLYPGNLLEYGRVLPSCQSMKKLLYCKRIGLEKDEIGKLDNATAEVGWSKEYLDYVYWPEDESMCLEDFKAAFMPGTSDARSNMNLLSSCRVVVIAVCALFYKVTFFYPFLRDFENVWLTH